ncbi:MFS transporter [Candidatus Bathyarchaeota archaeon]|nr:MFS transporter [Candidatus Bathyarchaeota archaeon]
MASIRSNSDSEKVVLGVSLPIFLLGLTSLFTDMSSEMIQAILPEFILSYLGSTYIVLGSLFGITDAIANLIKGFSGWLSEKLRRRKSLVIAGYSLSNLISKPLIGLQQHPLPVFFLKAGDRIGKGIRTAPRDALIGYHAGKNSGTSFGLHRAMDTTGAVLGPLVAMILVLLSIKLPSIILLSLFPGLAAVVVLLFVEDVEQGDEPSRDAGKTQDSQHRQESNKGISNEAFEGKITKQLLRTVSLLALIEFASLNTGFVIARAGDFLPSAWVLLMYALFNIVYALVSLKAGKLSDKIGRKRIIIIGLLVLIITTILLALPWDPATLVPLIIIPVAFLIFGVHAGMVDPTARAMVSDLSATKKGKAYGLYYGLIGIVSIPETIIFGLLWEIYGPLPAFLYSAIALSVCLGLFAAFSKETVMKRGDNVKVH